MDNWEKQMFHSDLDLAGLRGNFEMANEYQDFIEFLQNKLGYDYVKELQDEFYKENENGELNIETNENG